MEDLEKVVSQIQERNKRVETDKAWEVSYTRRGFIAAITYVVAMTWLYFIGDTVESGYSGGWIHALNAFIA